MPMARKRNNFCYLFTDYPDIESIEAWTEIELNDGEQET